MLVSIDQPKKVSHCLEHFADDINDIFTWTFIVLVYLWFPEIFQSWIWSEIMKCVAKRD